MANDDDLDPEDELRKLFMGFLANEGQFDLSGLAGAAGLPSDPASFAALISQLQHSLRSNTEGKIDWSLATKQAQQLAAEGALPANGGIEDALTEAFTVATLWLGEATDIGGLAATPELLSRSKWVSETMPVFSELVEPLANSIADALSQSLKSFGPPEIAGMFDSFGSLFRSIGGTLFAAQLGQVVGKLSKEVVSGGDIGIPLLPTGHAGLLPQNVAEFQDGIDVPLDQVRFYLAVRELAHANLFRHAKWLRLAIVSLVTKFARGISVSPESVEELMHGVDASDPEQLQQLLSSGALIPPRTPEQDEAYEQLETMLALVEGWVDVVTAAATARLPRSDAIAEMVRRRRAAGGPAESALASLIGLELRPRRLREAAKMWRRVESAFGGATRDSLWAHPDLMPRTEHIDDPELLINRLGQDRSGASEADELDAELEKLLSQASEDGGKDDAADKTNEGSENGEDDEGRS